MTRRAGSVVAASVPSLLMGEPLDVRVYLPDGDAPMTSVYLLHGRGDGMDDWAQGIEVLDDLVRAGLIPPMIAVMPDAPWSDRAGYWVDSMHEDGRPIESAMIGDLVPWIDARFPAVRAASARVVAGYSMGGAGAVRYLAAHVDVFSAALALSPAVYEPLPPEGSSAREHGAFGMGAVLFDDDQYRALAYSTAFAHSTAFACSTALGHQLPGRRLFLAFGDDEYRHPDDPVHDIEAESAALATTARAAGVETWLHRYPGGHDWGTWRPAFRDGLVRMTSTFPCRPDDDG